MVRHLLFYPPRHHGILQVLMNVKPNRTVFASLFIPIEENTKNCLLNVFVRNGEPYGAVLFNHPVFNYLFKYSPHDLLPEESLIGKTHVFGFRTSPTTSRRLVTHRKFKKQNLASSIAMLLRTHHCTYKNPLDDASDFGGALFQKNTSLEIPVDHVKIRCNLNFETHYL